MRISDWSSDVCASDLLPRHGKAHRHALFREAEMVGAIEITAFRIGFGPDDPILPGRPAIEDRLQFRLALADQHDILRSAGDIQHEIGRASCRERVCKYV